MKNGLPIQGLRLLPARSKVLSAPHIHDERGSAPSSRLLLRANITLEIIAPLSGHDASALLLGCHPKTWALNVLNILRVRQV
jgi:hypothetical protein